jgi:hypothetical protein
MCLSGSHVPHPQNLRRQQQSASAPSAPLLHQQQQQQELGNSLLDYDMEEQVSFNGSEDANNAVDYNDSSPPAGLQPLSDQILPQNTAAAYAREPVHKQFSFIIPKSSVTAAAGSSGSPSNAAALALPWLAKSLQRSSNHNKLHSASRSPSTQHGSPYVMETSTDAFVGVGDDIQRITDANGSYLAACSISASLGNSGSSGTLAGLPAAAMLCSSSSCYMMDMDAALSSSSADATWQPGQPISLAATATDADRHFVEQVWELATKFKLDPYKSLDLCERVPVVRPECMMQIYKCCLLDVDAAAAACVLGAGGAFPSDPSNAVEVYGDAGSSIKFGSIFECVGDESKAAASDVDLTRADASHFEANDALATASQCDRAAAKSCYSDKKVYEQSASAARDKAASLRADALAARYAAFNRNFNTWHVDLSGLNAADAVSTFASLLGHITGLEYPDGVLMCVVTGAACNDTIEQTVSLEQRLLTCISERGGVACPDPDRCGSRAGRIANVVVSFIRVDPSSRVVDAFCLAAADAAKEEALTCQGASVIYSNVSQQYREEFNMLDAAKWQQQADAKASEARIGLSRSKALTFAAHNSSYPNSWCINLHGQSEASAVSKVEQQLLAFCAVGHPGGITLRIITGKGLHSVNKTAVVRPAVLKYLSEEVPREFNCEDGSAYTLNFQDRDGGNDGVVLVRILPRDESAGNSGAAGRA